MTGGLYLLIPFSLHSPSNHPFVLSICESVLVRWELSLEKSFCYSVEEAGEALGKTAQPRLNLTFLLELKSQALCLRLLPPEISFFLGKEKRGPGPCFPHFLPTSGQGACSASRRGGCTRPSSQIGCGRGGGAHLGLVI